jgi:hypothetical protein
MKLYDNLRSVLIPSGYKLGQIYPQKQLVMNDPAYWFNNATAGNYVNTPNAVINQITGEIEITAEIVPMSFGLDQNIVSKSGVSGHGMAYNFFINSSGGLSFSFNPNGQVGSRTTVSSTVSFSSVGLIINSIFWIKVTRNPISGDIQFFTSINGILFTQLGTTITSITGNLHSSTEPLFIGTWHNSLNFYSGRIRRVTISNTIGGTPRIDFNPNDFNWNASMLQNHQTFVSKTTGEVWTIHSTGQGYIMPYLETIPLTRGSAGSRSLPSGVIESMAANMPRLDSPLNGCPGILMEPPRTKLAIHSSDPTQAAWSKLRITPTTDTSTTPFQGVTAKLLTVNNSGAVRNKQVLTGLTAGTNYTFQCWVKRGNTDTISTIISDSGESVNSVVNYNFATNVLSGEIPGVRYLVSRNSKVLTDGWVLITIILIVPVGQTTLGYCSFMPGTSASGTLNDTLLVANTEIELGFYGTSPLITAGSTITRLADTITPASYHFIGLGNKGTIVVDYTLLGLHSASGSNPFLLVDNLNNSTNKLSLLMEFSNGCRVWDYINNVLFYTNVQTSGTRYKVLFKWDNNYGCCYVNGVKITEIFNAPTPYNLNYIRNMVMTTNSIRLNGLLTDNIAVSHLDCVKLTT